MLTKKFAPSLILLGIICLLSAPKSWAHPPDLYAQIEVFTFAPEGVDLSWRIHPSTSLIPQVWADADQDRNGIISEAEAGAWVQPRLAEMALSVDGSAPLVWELVTIIWPANQTDLADEAIKIQLTSSWRDAPGRVHQLQVHNQFEESLSVHRFYLIGNRGTAFARPTHTQGQLEVSLIRWDAVGRFPVDGRFPAHPTGTWQTTWDSGALESESLAPQPIPHDHLLAPLMMVSLSLVIVLVSLAGWRYGRRTGNRRPALVIIGGLLVIITFHLVETGHQNQTNRQPASSNRITELDLVSHLHAAEAAVPSFVLPTDALSPEAAFSFIRNYIDTAYGGNGKPGWVRAGDMDNDNDLDIVAGGGTALFIYENDGNAGGWSRFGSLDGTNSIGANGAVLYDVDGDTYLDVVSAQYNANLGWWENPGNIPFTHTPWTFHTFSNESRYLHDIILADLDEDGQAEEFVANLNAGYWNADITIKWYRPGADPTQLWESHTIETNRDEGAPHGHAGLDTGDIDGDDNVDLAYSNGWYEAPDDPTGSWTWHEVTDIYGISNALLRNMDGDGDLDLIVAGGHHGQGLFWLENPPDPFTEAWTQHNISAVAGDITQRRFYDASLDYLHHPECVSPLDLDGDTDLDILVCDLFFGEDANEPDWSDEAHNIYVYENQGDALTWITHNVAPNSFPNHLLNTADINEDGQMDIIGESSGHSVISYFQNSGATTAVATPTICPNGGTFGGLATITLSTTPLDADLYYTLDGTPPTQADLLYSLPFTITQSLTVQAKGYKDGLDASGVASADFTILPFHFDLNVVDDSYPGNGRPGWSAAGDIDGDGLVDVVSGGGGAIQWYEAPDWTRHPLENSSTTGGNGGLVIDVDRDNDLDVVAALFNSQLVWWQNPGPTEVASPWARHVIDATLTQGYNHDLAYGDIDGDSEGEIVALYVAAGGVVWYDVPADPTTDPWPATQILSVSNDPYVGLAIADIDKDTDLDVVASNKWYERPSDPSTPNWTERTIFAAAVQNLFPYDVNGDERIDIVAAEGFVYPDGSVLWAEAPVDPKTQSWTVHTVNSSLDGPENIWAGDLDGDGITDIVTGEMETSDGFDDDGSNLLLFEGLNQAGTSWNMHTVAQNVGVSARLNPVDVDGDGDIDFAADGNAEDHIYLWLNKDGSSPVSCGIVALDEHIYLPVVIH